MIKFPFCAGGIWLSRTAESHKNFFQKSVDKREKVCYNKHVKSKGENLPERWQLMKYYDIENMADYEEEMTELMREIAEEEEKGE